MSYNIDRLHELDEVGVVGFKCFVATCGDRGIDNDFRDVNDWQFFKGAQKLGEEAKREGRVTAHDYVASRPVFTEVEAIRRVLYLAKVAGCRLHVCHISSPEGVEEVTRARQEGQDVTCESCRITLYWIPISSKKSALWRSVHRHPRFGKPERHVGKTV